MNRLTILVLESKEDMKQRGLDSPDSGDALALTFAQPVDPLREAEKRQSARDRDDDAIQVHEFPHSPEAGGDFSFSPCHIRDFVFPNPQQETPPMPPIPNVPNEAPEKPAPPRPRSGQFAKGSSGNPAGRPRGSRNQATLLVESLLQEQAEPLTRKTMEMALAGEPIALRICMNRLLPIPKDRPLRLDLGPVETLPQITAAMPRIAQAVCHGQITPSEGATVTSMLATHSQVLELQELRDRVAQLAEDMAALKKEKAGSPIIDVIPELQEGRNLLEAPHDPA